MANQALGVRVISHNIRYPPKQLWWGEKPWSIRCPRLCAELVYNSLHPASTFICLQEVIHSQLIDILAALNSDTEADSSWASIGVGRDDGKEAGEYTPILYRPAVWKVEWVQTKWLSENPDVPSRGWDAACVRIVTIGVFRHRTADREVVVMNTHFDHHGGIARAESAKLILRLVQEYQWFYGEARGARNVVLTGDFNSRQRDEAYKIMTGSDSGMLDVRTCIPEDRRYGHAKTFTFFGGLGGMAHQVIDFIFCNSAGHFSVKTFGVLENVFDDGVYLSDHRALVCDLRFP
ncbi:endonuclease/exonuclease/phosphatase [Acephala macrosclerotiorum]|nr:endonuclease/exonuclease/phosphatase [Acephala macrosclerotiorum]KAF8847657.1 endonuclease/exonuclease/phosphatase [Acephala macrosclerotiorum]